MSTARGLVAIAACALVLAGCGVETEPELPASAPTVTTPTQAPAVAQSDGPSPYAMDQLPERLSDLVSEPVFPDAAREFTTDGAAAFSQYVVDAVNWAYATGDSSFLLNHCAEDSGFCAGVRDDATMMVTDGRVRHGGMLSYAIDTVELYPNEDDAFVVGVTTVTATVDLDSDGRALTETDERELDVTMQMAFSDGGWTLLLAGGG